MFGKDEAWIRHEPKENLVLQSNHDSVLTLVFGESWHYNLGYRSVDH